SNAWTQHLDHLNKHMVKLPIESIYTDRKELATDSNLEENYNKFDLYFPASPYALLTAASLYLFASLPRLCTLKLFLRLEVLFLVRRRCLPLNVSVKSSTSFSWKATMSSSIVFPSRCPMYIQNSLVAGLSLPPLLSIILIPVFTSDVPVWLLSGPSSGYFVALVAGLLHGATGPNNMLSTSCCVAYNHLFQRYSQFFLERLPHGRLDNIYAYKLNHINGKNEFAVIHDASDDNHLSCFGFSLFGMTVFAIIAEIHENSYSNNEDDALLLVHISVPYLVEDKRSSYRTCNISRVYFSRCQSQVLLRCTNNKSSRDSNPAAFTPEQVSGPSVRESYLGDSEPFRK
ncbi:hypothetical protein L9F63_022467, partial [Diploptera punctata]